MADKVNYGKALLQGFEYLLSNHPEVFVIGQGLWSPWYVGSSMTDLEKKFGKDRVIDTPVSELACTGSAIGASLAGYRPIVVHPRLDFMLLAVDQIVNQAAKWHHMLGGSASPARSWPSTGTVSKATPPSPSKSWVSVVGSKVAASRAGFD